MANVFLIGLGAGLVSAVVFASATTGPLLIRFLLFLVTPLPMALAGLGWGVQAAAVGGIVGAVVVALASTPLVGLVFAASQALPVVVLSYLVLLARPAPTPPGAAPTLEWYPTGRLVVWATLIAGALAAVLLLTMGGDLDELRTGLRAIIEKAVKEDLPQISGAPPLADTDIETLTEVAMVLLPAATAVSSMTGLLLSLWLAGRVTLASGQLARPWPDLAAIEYPRGTPLALAASLLASGIEGLPGMVAAGFAGAFFLAYVLLGLAVIHYLTRGATWRGFALWGLYISLLVVNSWIALIVAVIGLADSFFGFRRARPPPSASHD